MAGSIIIKPAVQQRFDSFIQRGRVLFVSAPCGFGKSTLADALLEGRSVLRLSAGAPDFCLLSLQFDTLGLQLCLLGKDCLETVHVVGTIAGGYSDEGCIKFLCQ